jgi:sec-independent protein translocase protein TatA
MFGTTELILILAVFLLLFGADKLPELAYSLGKSAKEFKKAQMEVENELTMPKKHFDDVDIKIHNLAIDMGIDTKNKTTERLVEEIRTKISPLINK